MEECSNCGVQFKKGEGFPEILDHKFETCCTQECWEELLRD